MGERNKAYRSIILTVKDQGENNRLVTFLTAEHGIETAILYGGPKSKLKSLVQPFNSGLLYLYADETKKQTKITDFDVKSFHPTLRENLYKMWAANLGTEIVMKTLCGGDYMNSFILLNAFLDGIDASDEQEARLGTVRFLWRYLGILGVQPEVHVCSECGQSILSNGKKSFYIPFSSGILCSDCAVSFEDRRFPLDSYGLTYLAAINEFSPGTVRSLEITAESAYRLKNLVFFLIEQASMTKLKSLESGMGIL